MISELVTTLKLAAVLPLKVTLVEPVRLVPRILTAAPALPDVGTGSTKGPRPTDRRKTVPELLSPAALGRAVEVPVRGLDEPALGIGAIGHIEAVQRRQHALGGDLKTVPQVAGEHPAPLPPLEVVP